ncbi:MAG: extracellular solute-binding protein [Actinomycetota bacterium]|nr:extracellular solute-binding protein [Actinomycetota bacterium]MDQ5807990.1 extracellular solute-binding protein [Actinomycetota bacterium]
MLSRVLVAAAVLVTSVALTACGGDGGGGANALNFYIFYEPGGGIQKVAKQCSDDSGGKYNIEFKYLPSQADAQREQLVRRLGAEDESIDLMGLDIIWTGEFANAGWLDPVPEDVVGPASSMVFQSVLETAKFEDRMYAVPIWSNTQLLWYRKDKVQEPPATWDEMIDIAEREGMKINVQANRYEGLVVWANAMLQSAGTEFVSGPTEVALEEEPTKRALEVMGRLASSKAAPTGIDTSTEDSARLGFETGDSVFMVNYPFVYSSAKENAPKIFENMGAAVFPKVDEDKDAKPPLGGINIGVSAFSKKKDLAYEAIRCLIKAENQTTIAEMGGLPPVREDLYDEEAVKKIYPGFSDVMRQSIRLAGPRPSESPAYTDLSLGIQRGIHPVTNLTDPDEAYDRLKDYVEQAVKREGIL